MKEVCYPFYVFQLLGIETVVLTNAAGGINRSFEPGTLMLITDTINMMGTNPLIGPNDERFGPRFPDMTEIFSHDLLDLARSVADKQGIEYKEGVYMGFMGPCYETAAEIRAFAALGADAVGMSTVPEGDGLFVSGHQGAGGQLHHQHGHRHPDGAPQPTSACWRSPTRPATGCAAGWAK